MINNLSTELILEILVYLDYGNIENLSWTQKRYMMIVQRHFPEALEQKIWIRKISIVPSENNSSRLQTYQVEIRLPIDDQYKDDVDPITSIQVTGYIDKHTDRRANQENYKLTFNHFKRFFEWRKSNVTALIDNEKWLYPIRYPANTPLREQISLSNYCNGAEMKETNGSGLKFIELRSFLARIKTDVLDISKVDRDNFWTIVNCVDSARTVIKEKNIRCKDLKLEPRDKSRIEKFPFFRSGVIIEFYLKSPPFAMELLNTGLFTKTFMYFTSIDSEQLKIIPFSSHYSLWVFLVDKQNHLNEFFKNLLQAPPANREWRIINFSMELAWNVGCDMIERVFNECNIQPALEYGLNSRSYKITNDDPENQWILKITYQNIKEFYHDYVIAQSRGVW